MDDSLSLSNHLLWKSQHLFQVGQSANARQLLRRLVDSPDVSVSVRAEGHRLLGQLEMERRRYLAARRHLAAAIRLCRHDAGLYALYAAAVEADPAADSGKGLTALRRAVAINPVITRYWIALGRAADRCGQRRRARRAFQRAARLALDDLACLADIVDGLLAMGCPRQAAAVVSAARFRAPHDARILQLWNRVRFDTIRRRQEARKRSTAGIEVILKFPEPSMARTTIVGTGTVVRLDRGSRPTPHLLRLSGSRPDPRQAQ